MLTATANYCIPSNTWIIVYLIDSALFRFYVRDRLLKHFKWDASV
jgi:hypothetical protein